MNLGEKIATLPRHVVTNAAGALAITWAALSLAGAFLVHHEYAVAFWLGSFSTALAGAIVLFSTAKVETVRRLIGAARARRDAGGRLHDLFEISPAAVAYMDATRRYRLANRAFVDSHDRGDPVGRSMEEILGEEAYRRVQGHFERALGGEPVRFEQHVDGPGGEPRLLDTMYSPYRDADGSVAGVFEVAVDVSERRRAEARLRDSELRQRTLLENAPACIFELDLDGVVVSANPAAHRMLAATAAREPVGARLYDLLPSGESEQIASRLRDAAAGRTARFEFTASAGGERRVYAASLAPLRDPHGRVTRAMCVAEDSTDARDLADRLAYEARYDSLTGLVNRREFETRLGRVLATARETGSHHALCFLDLDRLKVINDTAGHVAGDELLRQIGSVLQQSIRKRDTLARIGGDEFAVLMEHCSIDTARRVAEDLRAAVAAHRFVWDRRSFRVGVSIGAIPISETSEGLVGVLAAADAACYAAKDRGRNRVHVHDEDGAGTTHRRGGIAWAGRIERALASDSFALYCQPVVPVAHAGRAGGLQGEVLLRLLDNGGEPGMPSAFLPAAERFSLATSIDRWVVESAVAWLEARREKLQRIACLSVNLSEQTLGDDDFLDDLLVTLHRAPEVARRLAFEFSETAATSNLTRAARLIHALRALGCRFALDDFGGGLSSFAYLKTLKVDVLKIDGLLVRDAVRGRVDRAVVKAINDIGHEMNMQTVAKLVDGDAALGVARDLGIDYAQGYHVGAPRPMTDVETW